MHQRILEIVTILSQTRLSVQERLRVLCKLLSESTGKQNCVYLVKDNGFCLAAGYPENNHGIGKMFEAREHKSLSEVVRTKRVLLIKKASTSRWLSKSQREWAKGSGVESILFVPVTLEGECLGVIAIDRKRNQQFSSWEKRFFKNVAAQVAWAIKNARLYEAVKEKEQELVKMAQLATLGQEFATLAHDLRNPLTTIGGFARHLKERISNGLEAELAEIIVKETRRLEEWLNSHLNFLRGQISATPLALNRFLKDFVLQIQKKWPDVEIDISGLNCQECLILADTTQLERVIFNLLKNAIEAVSGDDSQGRVWLKTWLDNNKVCLEIGNDSLGRPIPESDIDRIFEPFFTTKSGGVGLGLALVYQVLNLHQAEISVTSDIKKTIFLIKFQSL